VQTVPTTSPSPRDRLAHGKLAEWPPSGLDNLCRELEIIDHSAAHDFIGPRKSATAKHQHRCAAEPDHYGGPRICPSSAPQRRGADKFMRHALSDPQMGRATFLLAVTRSYGHSWAPALRSVRQGDRRTVASPMMRCRPCHPVLQSRKTSVRFQSLVQRSVGYPAGRSRILANTACPTNRLSLSVDRPAPAVL